MLERTKQVFNDLVERMSSSLSWLLPELLAMLAIMVVVTVAAVMVRAVLRRFLARIEFDRRLREWGLTLGGGEHGPGKGPTAWAARGAFWLVVGLGVLICLSVFDSLATRRLAGWLAETIPALLVASGIFLVAAAASRFLERSVLISAVNMGLHSARLVALGVRWLVLLFGTAMAVAHLGIGGGIVTLAFGILFGGIVLALALAVGLGARGMVGRTLEKRFSGPPEEAGREEKSEEISHL